MMIPFTTGTPKDNATNYFRAIFELRASRLQMHSTPTCTPFHFGAKNHSTRQQKEAIVFEVLLKGKIQNSCFHTEDIFNITSRKVSISRLFVFVFYLKYFRHILGTFGKLKLASGKGHFQFHQESEKYKRHPVFDT